VEGLDYDAAELPAAMVAKLDAVRADLLDRSRPRVVAPESQRSVSRLRIASLVAAGVFAVGAAGAGASALVTGSTGVPAVDRLLGLYEAELGESGAGKDLTPGSSGASATVEVPIGSRRLVSTSYVAKDGRICSVLADSERDPGDIVCVERAPLATRLVRDGGIVVGVEDRGDTIVLRGFVTGETISLDGRGPGGPLDVSLGGEWDGVPGVDAVRPFAATGRSISDGLINPSDYVLQAVDEDGDSADITP
jgi:hypothetical protein